MNRHSISAAGMASLLTISAVNHFRNPKFYNAVVPRSISTDTGGALGVMTRRQWTHLSGGLEFAAAAGLLLPATRRAAATATLDGDPPRYFPNVVTSASPTPTSSG